MKNTAIKLFEEKQVRSIWNEEEENWYFSIVDVIGILSERTNPNNYWKVLKHRLIKEGSQLVTACNQLKMQSSDGKFYKTDVAGNTRKEIEEKTGKKVVSKNSAEKLLAEKAKKIE